MHFSHEVVVFIAADAVDLTDWLFNLTEEEYAACARAHRAIGIIGGERRLGMVNVESIGGSLLIQHYATRRAAKNHVTMVSEASRAYLLHLVPVKVGVIWEMQVIPKDTHSSLFRCTIDVTMPPAVRLMSYTIATPWFISQHLIEETIGFARDIQRKLDQRRTGALALADGMVKGR